MDFPELLRARRMVRRYRDRPVAAGSLDRILAAARRAPSAGFSQGVEIVVVTSLEGRQRLADRAAEAAFVAAGQRPWLSRAPVHIVLAVDPARYAARYREEDKAASVPVAEWPVPYWWVDAGAALMLMLLATADEGLAAGFLGAHAFDDLAEAVDLPDHFEAVGVVTVGHAADPSAVGSALRPRRQRKETEHHERWQGPPPSDSGVG